MERLRERGVDLAGVAHGAKSGVTLILPHGPRRHILTYPGTISELRFEDLDLDYLASARHFHMSLGVPPESRSDLLSIVSERLPEYNLSSGADNAWSFP